MSNAAWWAYWTGVLAVGLTAAAALAGVFAWHFSNRAAAESAARTQALELRIAEQQERAANAERALIELRERARPRSLTVSQRQTLLAALKSAVPKSPVEVSSPTGDGEARNFALQLSELLRQAGWLVAWDGAIVAELATGTGVHLVVRDPALPPASAGALRNALAEAGIQSEESAQPENIPVGTVRLAVKSKPQ